MDHIARALLFHHHSRKWSRRIVVASPDFYSAISGDEMVPHAGSIRAIEVTQNLLRFEPIYGDNPEVFRYRLQYDSGDESYAFAAQFYESFEVYAFSAKVMDDAIVEQSSSAIPDQ
jgi:hypothetical protein